MKRMKRLSKLIFAACVLLPIFNVQAEEEKSLHKPIYEYTKAVCQVPKDMSPLILVYVEWYVAQIYYPDMKKLFLSMYNGINMRSSKSAKYAVCVAKFIGIPLDPVWERSVNLNEWVKRLDVAPRFLLDEVLPDGTFTVKRNPDS